MNNPPLVLIVDDEENFREIFSAKLTEAGFQVKTAKDGEEGYKSARELKPDLILMDMEMPVLNGAGAVMKLKNDPKTKDIKVVFLTNFGDPRMEMREADVHFSKEIGANDYLRKTDDLDKIASKVKSFF
ncbi:MAG: response regulator [Candidatus Liptonbacteria bacterium]|nr:response regulator [Candidatus Liptonbacteria bacterium]